MIAMLEFPSPERTWALTIILLGSVQSLAFQVLQTTRPRYTWIFLLVQCSASYVLIQPPEERPPEKIFTWKTLRHSVLYMAYIALPLAAFLVSPTIGSVTLATALRSSAITMNLLLQRKRSIIQWYGAMFINIGLFYLLFSLEWPASMRQPILGNPNGIAYLLKFVWQTQLLLWHNLAALLLIATSVLAGVLLGIDQEIGGRDDYYVAMLTCTFLLPLTITDMHDFTTEMVFVAIDNWLFFPAFYTLICSSAVLAFAIREYAEGVKNCSYKMTYVTTIRRFLTVIVGAIWLHSAADRNTILIALVIMAFGVAINEAYFAIERLKAQRELDKQQQQQHQQQHQQKQQHVDVKEKKTE